MRTEVKSGGLNNSRVTTPAQTSAKSFKQLTKKQLLELLMGNITQPITPADLYRCAVSIVAKWCNEVIADRYASMFDVTNGLESLEKLYKNR